eukprot:gnl/TRDRNA2_/TRDRNA2_136282_c0_seq1.p1 gnl/TRDRNA2_/TRDRNA2_136282_c0~~gnl/TRDRNA2_/TRDRNA2_136282_c0_seq1.p1  ORF type:complete len:447 (-),score=36.63 gnl/TRDRNA2_/TRDRNA2_136282_c0_seq1:281-1621(-)
MVVCFGSVVLLFAMPVQVRPEEPPIGAADLPIGQFPARTAAESNAAWPRRAQPKPLEAWPLDASGKPQSCWKVEALSDTVTGWPGSCRGLTKSDRADTLDSCRKECENDSECSVWQFIWHNGCWHNEGTNCESSTVPNLVGAQRLQHGAITRLLDITDIQISGLSRLGSVGVTRCKKFCYSNLRCQYWQYRDDECFVEVPEWGSTVPYPLTTGSNAARRVSREYDAGEYIQHYCPEFNTTPLPTIPPEKNWLERLGDQLKKGDPMAIVGLVAPLLLITGMVVKTYCGGSGAGGKRSLSVGRNPREPRDSAHSNGSTKSDRRDNEPVVGPDPSFLRRLEAMKWVTSMMRREGTSAESREASFLETYAPVPSYAVQSGLPAPRLLSRTTPYAPVSPHPQVHSRAAPVAAAVMTSPRILSWQVSSTGTTTPTLPSPAFGQTPQTSSRRY